MPNVKIPYCGLFSESWQFGKERSIRSNSCTGNSCIYPCNESNWTVSDTKAIWWSPCVSKTSSKCITPGAINTVGFLVLP